MNPVWNIARVNLSCAPLTKSREADTAIIGGGITGLVTGLMLVEAGQRVVVLEALRLADGGAGRSTGNLYGTLSNGLTHLREKYDAKTVRGVVKGRVLAIDFIEKAVKRYAIDCDFARPPMYPCIEAGSTCDCPCHGNRFSPEGKLLEGPAYEDLAVHQIPGPLKSEAGH